MRYNCYLLKEIKLNDEPNIGAKHVEILLAGRLILLLEMYADEC